MEAVDCSVNWPILPEPAVICYNRKIQRFLSVFNKGMKGEDSKWFPQFIHINLQRVISSLLSLLEIRVMFG